MRAWWGGCLGLAQGPYLVACLATEIRAADDARRVAQKVMDGDGLVSRAYAEPGQVPPDRRLKVYQASLGELQQGDGRERLADGTDLE